MNAGDLLAALGVFGLAALLARPKPPAPRPRHYHATVVWEDAGEPGGVPTAEAFVSVDGGRLRRYVCRQTDAGLDVTPGGEGEHGPGPGAA